ncbi:hypothetical protein COCVIDRAFT_116826 [Bipolaris victoriae FI3]|uniref:Probable transporter vicT n=1 Tax=Bipolaris victoriae (strain FI3) TaxID=930091 RepID=VICT_BIPV3|nr:hypothetical protein COCVIDRAFT_116826 [Bipolaris victoriae FI3]W7DWT4.1 RecName: Full=Probable transporter vicT; AltName: Full=Victorin biosynthesis cluster protein T [Bipolaris victoriae FI3]
MEKPTRQTPFYTQHRAELLVLSSQIAAALLHALARVVEVGSGLKERVHPFTVLQIRLFITVLGCTAYLWRARIDFLGPTGLRPLLALRAAGGVFGACGFYLSISYLSLSEATVLNFIAPLGAIMLTTYWEGRTFAFLDLIACITALAGVVLVLQPIPIYKAVAQAEISSSISTDPYAHLKGVVSGITGVAGGIVAFSAMNRLGKNVQPAVTINYFGVSICIVTTAFSTIMPEVVWPTRIESWCLLAIIGILGLVMEYLLTAGLGSDDPRVTIMIYSQVLWALFLDWAIWRSHVNVLTVLGSMVVVASLAVPYLFRESSHPKEDMFSTRSGMDDIEEGQDEAHANYISLE